MGNAETNTRFMQIQIETGAKEGATGGPGRPAISVPKGLNKTAERSRIPGLVRHGCESHEGANGGRAAHFQKAIRSRVMIRAALGRSAEAMMRTQVGRPNQSIQPTATAAKVSCVGRVKQGMKLKSIASNADTFLVEPMAVPPIRVP